MDYRRYPRNHLTLRYSSTRFTIRVTICRWLYSHFTEWHSAKSVTSTTSRKFIQKRSLLQRDLRRCSFRRFCSWFYHFDKVTAKLSATDRLASAFEQCSPIFCTQKRCLENSSNKREITQTLSNRILLKIQSLDSKQLRTSIDQVECVDSTLSRAIR